MARAIGVDGRTVRRIHEAQGIFPKNDAGKYNIAQCVQAYIAYKIESETRKSAKGDYDAQRARREEVRIEIDKLRLRRMRGELHEAQVVEEVWNEMLVAFRAKLLALPSKLAPLLLGMTEPADMMKLLETQALETLEALAEYDPEDYSANVGDVDDDDEEDEGWEDEAITRKIAARKNGKAAGKGAACKPGAAPQADRKHVGGTKPHTG